MQQLLPQQKQQCCSTTCVYLAHLYHAVHRVVPCNKCITYTSTTMVQLYSYFFYCCTRYASKVLLRVSDSRRTYFVFKTDCFRMASSRIMNIKMSKYKQRPLNKQQSHSYGTKRPHTKRLHRQHIRIRTMIILRGEHFVLLYSMATPAQIPTYT